MTHCRSSSSPKLVLWNNALVSALSLRSFSQVQADAGFRGRLGENAVGAHLVTLGNINGTQYNLCTFLTFDGATGAINADPQFVDIATYNYKPSDSRVTEAGGEARPDVGVARSPREATIRALRDA